jgi:hypothetical protein
MKMIRKVNCIAFIVCCLLLQAFALRLSAQVATGRITGRVTDSTRAAISGATVTITNDATSVAQEAVRESSFSKGTSTRFVCGKVLLLFSG